MSALVHATVGTGASNGKPFKACARKAGLRGSMRSTTPGPEFTAWMETLFKRIGPWAIGPPGGG
jgi:hypothetical protein